MSCVNIGNVPGFNTWVTNLNTSLINNLNNDLFILLEKKLNIMFPKKHNASNESKRYEFYLPRFNFKDNGGKLNIESQM